MVRTMLFSDKEGILGACVCIAQAVKGFEEV
ncbi:hypothetical protein PS910_01335 [Pseudomonas fluorescens]|nr:hypothetical protein PS910_01335 [Pseudomonas fluorescens]